MNSPASTPGLWRRFTAAYARLLTGLLAFSVAIIIIPVTLQMVSRYTALIPSYIWTEEMARFLFICAKRCATKTLATIKRDGEFDGRHMAGEAVPILGAGQRAINTS